MEQGNWDKEQGIIVISFSLPKMPFALTNKHSFRNLRLGQFEFLKILDLVKCLPPAIETATSRHESCKVTSTAPWVPNLPTGRRVPHVFQFDGIQHAFFHVYLTRFSSRDSKALGVRDFYDTFSCKKNMFTNSESYIWIHRCCGARSCTGGASIRCLWHRDIFNKIFRNFKQNLCLRPTAPCPLSKRLVMDVLDVELVVAEVAVVVMLVTWFATKNPLLMCK